MALLVQKFGGSSVGTTERIQHVARRVASAQAEGHQLVVVVSAMQGETDRLLGLASKLSKDPEPREVDQLLATGEQASAALLAMTLNDMGVRARSMTGHQMKVMTDGAFSRARIQQLDGAGIRNYLSQGEVIVATGFQGIDADGNITTLGRGGSDTSAVALAVGLNADECVIFTDVDGVYTADPRICPKARKIDQICFEEMMEMASLGSKVLQIRSVELAMNHGMPLRVRSTFSDGEGTLVTTENDSIEKLVVRGVSHSTQDAKFTLRRVPDQPGIASSIFLSLARAGLNVDVIVQNTSREGTTDVSFTVAQTDAQQAEHLMKEISVEIGAESIEVDSNIAKVSIVGVGMRAHPGVAAEMFDALRRGGINIQMITTSEIKVTVVIDENDCAEAVQCLHNAFKLDGVVIDEDADRATA